MAILRRFTPLVEPISIDEAFLDVTGSAALFGDGPTIARRIKDEIRAEVGLTASVGVASTKLVAKIASDLRKPDGLVVVPAGDEAAFLAPLPIARLWGVGEKTAAALAEYRRAHDRRPRRAATGPRRAPVRQARGVARRSSRAGSIRTRSTRAIRPSRSGTSTRSTSTRATRRSSSGRCWRWPTASPAGCARPGVRAGTVTVKIRDCSFRTITRQRTLAEPTDLTEPIYSGGARAGAAGDPRDPGPAARRDRLEPRRARAARAVRRRRAAAAAGGRGRRRGPASLRRAADHPGAAAAARACRRRSSATRGTRSTGAREACRAIATRSTDGDIDGRDSQGDTDVDDIPPDDA